MEIKEILIRVEKKVDKLDYRLDNVDKTLIVQEVNLAEHMRRTNILEAQHEKLYTELEPVKKHVIQIKTVVKILSFIIPIIGTIIAAYYKYGE